MRVSSKLSLKVGTFCCAVGVSSFLLGTEGRDSLSRNAHCSQPKTEVVLSFAEWKTKATQDIQRIVAACHKSTARKSLSFVVKLAKVFDAESEVALKINDLQKLMQHPTTKKVDSKIIAKSLLKSAKAELMRYCSAESRIDDVKERMGEWVAHGIEEKYLQVHRFLRRRPKGNKLSRKPLRCRQNEIALGIELYEENEDASAEQHALREIVFQKKQVRFAPSSVSALLSAPSPLDERLSQWPVVGQKLGEGNHPTRTLSQERAELNPPVWITEVN